MNVGFCCSVLLISLSANFGLKLFNTPIKRTSIATFLSLQDTYPDFERINVLPSPLKPKSQIEVLQLLHFLREYRSQVEKDTSLRNKKATSNHLKAMQTKSMKLEQIILRSNLRLVYSVAIRHQGMGIDINDLVYEGVKGLQKALSKYDVNRGCAFSTYAYPWIQDYIRAALAKSLPISLPRHVYKLLVKVKVVQGRLFLRYGRDPTEEELCDELGLSIEKFEIVRKAWALASHSHDATPAATHHLSSSIYFDESTWEQIIASNSEGSVMEHIESMEQHVDPDTKNVQSEVLVAIFHVLRTLPQPEAAMLYSRLGLAEFVHYLPNNSNNNYFFGHHDNNLTEKAASALYNSGMRRLRRRLGLLGDKYTRFLTVDDPMFALRVSNIRE
mmetsp:Transcript_2005/g.3166  ORF Transcript_2005/g.3166 Transcript_2005/m.3166 type:complete len:387 (+) Transcript_2005:136-1296(+)